MIKISDEKFREMIESILCPTLSYRSLPKDYYRPENYNPEICKKCGGECCQRCGCFFSPDDFEEISFEYLKGMMEKGYITIEFIDGEIILDDFGVYILRMRNQGAPVFDRNTKRTPCILWSETEGCKFDFEHRPTGGRLMEPTEKTTTFMGQKVRNCRSDYTLRKCCYEWKPHQKILRELAKFFLNRDVPCSL